MDINFTTSFLIVMAAAWILTKLGNAYERSRRPPLYCPHCGAVAQSKQVTRGSGWIEIVLWLCFLIPGLIYTIWRATSKAEVCSACGSSGIIPASSPNAPRELQTPAKGKAA